MRNCPGSGKPIQPRSASRDCGLCSWCGRRVGVYLDKEWIRKGARSQFKAKEHEASHK